MADTKKDIAELLIEVQSELDNMPGGAGGGPTYAPMEHRHPHDHPYADENHEHPYAPRKHEHDYSPKHEHPYAPQQHEHPYAPEKHEHDYSEKHEHPYAKENHGHKDLAKENHKHKDYETRMKDVEETLMSYVMTIEKMKGTIDQMEKIIKMISDKPAVKDSTTADTSPKGWEFDVKKKKDGGLKITADKK